MKRKGSSKTFATTFKAAFFVFVTYDLGISGVQSIEASFRGAAAYLEQGPADTTVVLKPDSHIENLAHPPRQEGAVAIPPTRVESTLVATEPFGPDTVPFEIYNSSDLKYRARLFMPAGNRRNNTNTCNTASFTKIDKSLLSAEVYPYGTLGRFYFSFNNVNFFFCTATQLGPDIILTAMHCVFECSTKASIARGTYYDRTYGQSNQGFSSFKTIAGWFDCDSNNIPVYDFAVVRLQQGLPKQSYPITTYSTADAVATTQFGFLLSYPARSQPGNIPFLSVQNPLSYRFSTPSRIEASLSTEPGSSGSPLFLNKLPRPQFNWSNAILGVDSYEFTNGDCPNGFAAFQGPANGYNANHLQSMV